MEIEVQKSLSKILVIQTAFPGDVILATGVLESLYKAYPQAKIDILLRKGNELLFEEHPFIHEVLILDKKEGKMSAISKMAKKVRENEYELLINLHRFGSSGLIAMYSGAKRVVGFKKNPFSFAYTQSFPHQLNGRHETERNFSLIQDLVGIEYCKPRLYPAQKHVAKVDQQFDLNCGFVCIAPSSVWFTKELPEYKWIELINLFPDRLKVVLVGASSDRDKCERILAGTKHVNCINLSGKLSLIESAALMQKAKMIYANDSAPLHLASAVNAPSAAFFLSTIPGFGFTGLSDNNRVIEIERKLECRPCGLHGHKACPKGHFNCAHEIVIDENLCEF
jgi:ADP-heptose:LPS heptosyltransferase